jgi:hypothetical protein
MSFVMQLLTLRSAVKLSDSALQRSRHFLPYVALSAVVVNWSFFAISFFYMQIVKYQLSNPSYYKFDTGALVCIVFIQILFSANFLHTFTAAGLWTQVFLR